MPLDRTSTRLPLTFGNRQKNTQLLDKPFKKEKNLWQPFWANVFPFQNGLPNSIFSKKFKKHLPRRSASYPGGHEDPTPRSLGWQTTSHQVGRCFFLSLSSCQKILMRKKSNLYKTGLSNWKTEIKYRIILLNTELIRTTLPPTDSSLS